MRRARVGWNVAVAAWALASVVVAMPAAASTDAGEAVATESVPPTILWVAAAPSSIASATTTTLHWNAPGATSASIAPGVGTVPPRGSVSVAPAATTTYTLTAGNAAGNTTKSVTVRVGPYPTSAPLRAVHMVTPLGGQRFTAPASLRLFASASNGFVDSGCGSDGNAQGCADRVDFYVDDQVVAQVPKTQSEYSVFKANVAGIAAGAHRVWARGIYTDPRGPMQTLDSEAMEIVVDPPPTYASTSACRGTSSCPARRATSWSAHRARGFDWRGTATASSRPAAGAGRCGSSTSTSSASASSPTPTRASPFRPAAASRSSAASSRRRTPCR